MVPSPTRSASVDRDERSIETLDVFLRLSMSSLTYQHIPRSATKTLICSSNLDSCVPRVEWLHRGFSGSCFVDNDMVDHQRQSLLRDGDIYDGEIRGVQLSMADENLGIPARATQTPATTAKSADLIGFQSDGVFCNNLVVDRICGFGEINRVLQLDQRL